MTEVDMAMVMRGMVVLGLLLGGTLGGLGGVVERLTAQIRTMEQFQTRLCGDAGNEEAGLCKTDPFAEMIRKMMALQERMAKMAGVDREPQGPPETPGEPHGVGEAAGPMGPFGPQDPYQCGLCEGDDCLPCGAYGPYGPWGLGDPTGPVGPNADGCPGTCAANGPAFNAGDNGNGDNGGGNGKP
jgi:hypothetical protein